MASLLTKERVADGAPSGLLILHHGRGTTESDLLPLAEVIDPERRLHVVSARAPFTLPGSPGYHWYAVPRVGYPDPESFATSYGALGELHDEVWERTGLGPEETILGGFSMGTVMSYALGLGTERPAPAGILAFSGFVPTVEGWQADVRHCEHLRVFISHGRQDPVIDVAFARRARDLLTGGGLTVEYHESEVGHQIEPGHVTLAQHWLARTLSSGPKVKLVEDPASEAARDG
ncbi:MAG: phospholipase [Actinomycetota bacterium]|nr:phospholipase [Actinomycetota bacterium]